MALALKNKSPIQKMRPLKNAFTGYTYQQQIAFLFLVIMAVKRHFDSLEIEADVDNNFDDVKILNKGDSILINFKDDDGNIKEYFIID